MVHVKSFNVEPRSANKIFKPKKSGVGNDSSNSNSITLEKPSLLRPDSNNQNSRSRHGSSTRSKFISTMQVDHSSNSSVEGSILEEDRRNEELIMKQKMSSITRLDIGKLKLNKLKKDKRSSNNSLMRAVTEEIPELRFAKSMY